VLTRLIFFTDLGLFFLFIKRRQAVLSPMSSIVCRFDFFLLYDSATLLLVSILFQCVSRVQTMSVYCTTREGFTWVV